MPAKRWLSGKKDQFSCDFSHWWAIGLLDFVSDEGTVALPWGQCAELY
jgi:hypothetical protein